MNNAKVCRVCGERKPLEAFQARKDAKDGRRNDCRACNVTAQREKYAADAERICAERAMRYEQGREQEIQARRDFRARERERINARRRDLRAEDPEKYRSVQRAHYERNAEAIRARVRTDKFRRRGVDLQALIDRDGLYCGICSDPLELADSDVDHIHPLALGGTNEIGNLRLAHPYCNRSMGNQVARQLRALALGQ